MLLIAFVNLAATGLNSAEYADGHGSLHLAFAVMCGIIALASLRTAYDNAS